MDGKRYILPSEPDTTELNCLLVFYPDRDEYFRALVGSLAHLGTWVAWERDAAHGAAIAARLWKDALDLTLDNMGCFEQISAILASMDNSLSIIAANMGNGTAADFSPIVDALGGIETAVSNLTFDSIIREDEMITINNCCSCGCSGSSGNPDVNLPPELPPDYSPPIPIPVPDEPNPEIDYMTVHKCAFAHYMFVKWRNVIIDTCGGGITLSNVIEKFQQAMADSPSVIGWAIDNWGELVTYVGLYLAGVVGYASQCAAEIDSKADAIKCAILAETSPDTKKQQVGVLIDIMALPLFVRSYMKQVFNLLPLDLLYGGYIEGGTAVPAWAYAAGCPGCVDTNELPLPTAPTNYKWQVGAMYGYSAGGGVTSVQSGNVMDVTVPAAGSDRFIQLRFNNFAAVGVYGIALVAELMPADFHVRNAGWYTNAFDVTPHDDNKYILFANKGAPVIDWGDYTVYTSDKALVLDVGRFDFLLGGGLFRFSCWELVPA